MKRLFRHLLAILYVVAFFPAMASAVETYKFDRMFPVLQQPWYFSTPSGLAIDSKGFIYVADMSAECIQKFTSDGFFVNQWGTRGNNDGEFYQPIKIAIDKDDYIYVTDCLNQRIQKFNSDGKFITKWGEKGKENGQFDRPKGIAIDNKNGFVYVTDTNNYRIQKFDLNGNFIGKWGGKQGSGDGEFQDPYAIAIDSIGNVYVADSENHRIQKFDIDGNIFKWGTQGKDNGQFQNPSGIFIDKLDNVYIADSKNHRIQLFDVNGNFKKAMWGSSTALSQYQDVINQNSDLLPLISMMIDISQPNLHIDKLQYDDVIDFLLKDAKEGTFNRPTDIVMDHKGDIYVADSSNQRIQKFGSDEKFVSSWGSVSNREGMFKGNIGIAINNNFLYVSDSKNHRIQKFTKDGKFAGQWGKQGSGNGEFQFPTSIAANNEFVYVVDAFNHRIQKFTAKGDYVTQWGGRGEENRQFQLPLGIALDKDGNVYVTDSLNFRILKFTPDGNFIRKWESAKIFGYPIDETLIGLAGIAVDNSGNIYATNIAQNRFQKFDSNGNFLYNWGGDRTQFQTPFGIAAYNNFVFVTDTGNSRIRQFTPDGVFVQDIGKLGPDVGQFRYPMGLAIDTERIYVADFANNRIQVFRNWVDSNQKTKAIIVAGRRFDNSIWNETQMNANLAYRALQYQGFTDKDIYYLSSNTTLDLDNDGTPDVDADASTSDLEYAITHISDWAEENADNLVVYLVDHGGSETFRISPQEELLASKLNEWLNTAQKTIPGTITVVYDACKSGSFLPVLKAPKRILISSASSQELANFTANGSVSFSSYFWINILNGFSLKQTFDFSKKAVEYTLLDQNPLLDIDGDGKFDPDKDILPEDAFIGNVNIPSQNAPQIGNVSVSPPVIQSTDPPKSEIKLCNTNITSQNPIARVWAIIRSPNFEPKTDDPLTDLPSVELMPKGDGCYYGVYDKFDTEGIYNILVYVRDDRTNTSLPGQAFVTVKRNHKAIIVLGASPEDDKAFWTAVADGAKLAYNTLLGQRYTKDDIYLLSMGSIEGLPVTPISADVKTLSDTIDIWTGSNVDDLVLYMLGNGEDGAFKINKNEVLKASDLNALLNKFQNDHAQAKTAVIYDACRAESFLQYLAGKQRIVIASTGKNQSVYFLSDGSISFSKYFWSRIGIGDTVEAAFDWAKKSLTKISCNNNFYQTPHLDQNGNGIGDEKDDFGFTPAFTIGAGIKPADSNTYDIDASVVNQGETAIIKADIPASESNIARVWAIINLCDSSFSPDVPITALSDKIELIRNPASGVWEGLYNKPLDMNKCKIVVVYSDQLPPPVGVYITSVSDITAISARAFGAATGEGITERGFFWWNDEQYWGDNASDLLPASGAGAGNFSLTLTNLPVSTQLYVSAYIKVGGKTVTAGPGNFVSITTLGPAPPTVITQSDFTVNGNSVLAKGRITNVGAFPVKIYGFVYAKHPSPTVWDMALPFTWDTTLPISQGKPFEGTIKNLSDGNYFFKAYAHNENPYTGGNPNTVYGEEFSFTIGSVHGDMNGDGKSDLADVILILQVLSGSDAEIRADYTESKADVNGDSRMGLEEAIYILQKIAELR